MATNKIQPGKLYLVATPIGNLQDITYRAVEVLRQADCIAAEDTRKSRILLKHYEIEAKRLVSYYGPKEDTKARGLLKLLLGGDSVALITDAGTPGISDPAVKITRLAIENGVDIVPVPGPSAFLTALSASGLDTSSFIFAGFLPIKKGKRLTRLKALCGEKKTVVLYESTHRIERLLDELDAEAGERRIVVAREITKMFEEFVRGTPSEVREQLTGKRLKGEFVVIIPSSEAHPV